MRPAAEAYGRYRAIDACGLHDPAAAQEASGDGSTGDELMPADKFDTCTLRLHKDEFNDTWTLYVRVAEKYDAARRREAAPEKIGGVELFVKEEGTPLPSCKIVRPLDDTFAIVLDVNPADRNNPARPPCDFARDYVTKAVDLWRDPPRHGSGRTEPALPLSQRDSCAAVASILADLGADTEIQPKGPYECIARSNGGGSTKSKGGAAGPAEITVEFGVDEDPTRSPSTSRGEQVVDLAGFKATIGPRAGQCRTVAIWDAGAGIIDDNRDDDPVPAVQVVTVETPTCEQGNLVEKILTAVGKP